MIFNGSSKLRDTIEREYQTILQRSSQGILVQGTERSVHLTVKKLKNLIDTLKPSDANALNPLLSDNDSEVNALTEQLKNLMTKPGSVDNMTDSLKKALLERLQDVGAPPTTGRDPNSSSSSSSPSSLIQYQKRVKQFVELGYPQDKVEMVVKSLGVEASDNDIMARLVSIHVPRPPITTGGAPSSSVSSKPEAPIAGLRPIVIDGSNIAMR